MIKKQGSNFYIIGAGFAGQMIAGDIKRKKIFGKVAAFLDDDKSLVGRDIDGIPVLGPIEDVVHLLKSTDSDEAVIAIPSAKVEKIKSIYESLKQNGFKHIKILFRNNMYSISLTVTCAWAMMCKINCSI